jgi:hypothetical protein
MIVLVGGGCTHEYEKKKKKKNPGKEKRRQSSRTTRIESKFNRSSLTSVRFIALKKTSTSYKAIKKKDDDDVLFVLFLAS